MLRPNDVIELAHTTAGGPEFYPRLLRRLQDAFECDVAALHVAAAYPVTGSGPLATLGFDPRVRKACARRWGTYVAELEPIAEVALGAGMVATDRDAFSSAQRARRAVYREFVQPQAIAETLVGYLCLRQQPIAALSLGRRQGAWSAQSRRELGSWLPALSVAIASARGAAGPPLADVYLTQQERRVLAGVEAGLSNAEIAVVCGSSVNTVRNQVASLLRKLDLSSRTQLAALGLGGFVEHHD